VITPEKVKFNTKDVVVYLAAAGAGKTTALMDEMTELLKVYRPDEIAFVTYTRKGVAHGKERALQANPQISVDDLVYFRTLHSLCFHELGLKRKAMVGEKHLKVFNDNLHYNLSMHKAFEKQTSDDKLLTRYDVLRSGGTKGVFVHEQYDKERYVILVDAYEKFKKKMGLVDFYDCLSLFRDRKKAVNAKVAFIDEAQDLTLLQWEVCQTAFANCEKIRISGDDYQCVFTYSGASPKTLVCLAKRYKAVKLESSYRLSEEVYKFSRGITRLIRDKIEKDYKPTKDEI